MAKREIPLFIFDTNRTHSLGECDFVSCTDVDNAFVARISFVRNASEMVTDNIRVTAPNDNGISCKMEVKRITGLNPNDGQIRTLMKKAMEMYTETTVKKNNSNEATDEEMIHFLDKLIQGNRHNLDELGSDYTSRNILSSSLHMLEAIRDRIKE